MVAFEKRNRRLISITACIGTAVLVWATLRGAIPPEAIYQEPAGVEQEPSSDPCANKLLYSLKALSPTAKGFNRMSIMIHSPQAMSRVRIITDMNTAVIDGLIYFPSPKAFPVFRVYANGTAQISSDKPVTRFRAVLYSHGSLAIRCVTAQ